jgi:acetoin utilization protein AcuB
MRVRELMTGVPITTSPETAVFDARRLMLKERIRHLIVLEHGRLVGIVTDRDIRLHPPSKAANLSLSEVDHLLARLTVEKVMSRPVTTVGPDRRAHEAARIMLEHKIGALPVVDGERLIGIITKTDLLRAFVHLADEPAGARR